jgi:hypothetical protein
MFVNGKFESIEGLAWAWLAAALLPGSLLLNAGALLNQRPAKLIAPVAHRVLLTLTGLYLVALLLSLLLSQRAIEQRADYGLQHYLQDSLLYLLPLSLLLALGFWQLFFRKESLFQPNPAIIADTASTQAAQARRKQLLEQTRAYELVAAADLPAAFELLNRYFEAKNDTPRRDELLLLQNGHASLLREKNMNTIDPEQAQRNLNRITLALLTLIAQVQG